MSNPQSEEKKPEQQDPQTRLRNSVIKLMKSDDEFVRLGAAVVARNLGFMDLIHNDPLDMETEKKST